MARSITAGVAWRTSATYFFSSSPKPRSALARSKARRADSSSRLLRSASSAITACAPRSIRSRFLALIWWMPGNSRLTERVPIRPRSQGISISQSFLDCASSIHATIFRPAGAGSVSHIASSAAILVCCASPTV